MVKRLKGLPNLPFAPIVGALFGLVAAILVFATPAWLLEKTVETLGISAVLSAAQPPLGDTARALIAAVTGLGVGLALWLCMRPIEKRIHARRAGAKKPASAVQMPSEDAQQEDYDVAGRLSRGGRSPIFAGSDLGAPLMSDEALASGGELFLQPSMQEQQEDVYHPNALQSEPDYTPGGYKAYLPPQTEVVDLGWPSEERAAEQPTTVEAPVSLDPPAGWDEPMAAPTVALETPAPAAPDWDAAPFSDYALQSDSSPVQPLEQPVVTEDLISSLAWPGTAEAQPAPIGIAVEDAVVFETIDDGYVPQAIEPEPAPIAPVADPLSIGDLLKSAAVEAPPPPSPVEFSVEEPEQSSVPEPLDVVVAETHPVEFTTPEPFAPVQEQVTASPASEQEDEPSLRELLSRLEVALDHRSHLSAQGQQLSAAPAAGTVASLRDLIAANQK